MSSMDGLGEVRPILGTSSETPSSSTEDVAIQLDEALTEQDKNLSTGDLTDTLVKQIGKMHARIENLWKEINSDERRATINRTRLNSIQTSLQHLQEKVHKLLPGSPLFAKLNTLNSAVKATILDRSSSSLEKELQTLTQFAERPLPDKLSTALIDYSECMHKIADQVKGYQEIRLSLSPLDRFRCVRRIQENLEAVEKVQFAFSTALGSRIQQAAESVIKQFQNNLEKWNKQKYSFSVTLKGYFSIHSNLIRLMKIRLNNKEMFNSFASVSDIFNKVSIENLSHRSLLDRGVHGGVMVHVPNPVDEAVNVESTGKNFNIAEEIERCERQIYQRWGSLSWSNKGYKEAAAKRLLSVEEPFNYQMERHCFRRLEELDPEGEQLTKALMPLIESGKELDAIMTLAHKRNLTNRLSLQLSLDDLVIPILNKFPIVEFFKAVRSGDSELRAKTFAEISIIEPAVQHEIINRILRNLIQSNEPEVLRECLAYFREQGPFVEAWREALGTENRNLIEPFLDNGTTINFPDANGNTLMHLSIRDPDFLRVIHRRGGNLNAKNRAGDTPLHLCIQTSALRSFEYLLTSRADIDVQNYNGHTPLHTAVMMGSIPFLDALIAEGARVNQANAEGQTPLHVTSSPEAVEKLMKAGADPDVRDARGFTPLSIALLAMNFTWAQALVGAGAHTHLEEYHKFRVGSQTSALGLAKVCLARNDFYTPEFLALKGVMHSWKSRESVKFGTKFIAGEAGVLPYFSLEMLGSFQKFSKEYPEALSKEGALQLEEFLHSGTQTPDPSKLLALITEGSQPALLPSGYSTHAVSVFFYKGFLVIANKGAASRRPLEVYRINNAQVTAASIARILQKSSRKNGFKQLLEDLPRLFEIRQDDVCTAVESSYPLGVRQEIGNCAWESQETAVFAFMALHRLTTGPVLTPAEREQELKIASTLFTDWVSFTKLFTIEEYMHLHELDEMKDQSVNEVMKKIFLIARTEGFPAHMQKWLSDLENRFIRLLPPRERADFTAQLVASTTLLAE